jgi:hypothetical protein
VAHELLATPPEGAARLFTEKRENRARPCAHSPRAQSDVDLGAIKEQNPEKLLHPRRSGQGREGIDGTSGT